jgi:hypothetical protein
VQKLVQQLGVERMSRSQVSRLAKSLDRIVEDFRTRPLDRAPYAYVTLVLFGEDGADQADDGGAVGERSGVASSRSAAASGKRRSSWSTIQLLECGSGLLFVRPG